MLNMIRRLTRYGLAVVCLTLPCSAEEQLVRILSYNIHHGEGLDGKIDLSRIAQIILAARPDIVALQEVDCNTSRTGQVDQAAELARLTQLQVCFGANLDFGGGRYGNAVLTSWRIENSRNVLLESLQGGEQRGVLLVDLKRTPESAPLLILATHLDHRPDDAERRQSALRINQLAGESLGMDQVLVGDLNATRPSQVLTTLCQEWRVAGQEELPTIPAASPRSQIDFVLYRPIGAWRVIEVRVLDEALASDHRPILAVLERLPQ